jgi:hypothetical protein
MTGPRLARRNYGRGHGYQIDGAKVPGVTTILNTLPKDALINWAAKVTAEAAIDRWDELAGMSPSKRLKELTDARWNITKEAALRGTEIHAMGDKLAQGLEVDPGVHRGEVEAYARFLDRWDIEVLGTEAPCGSTRFRYAGTLDSIVLIRGLAAIPEFAHLAESPVMLDVKTGRGVYESTALQLGGYAGCDVWQPNGPDSEAPMPKVEGLFVAHVLTDDVELLPVRGDIEALLTQFRYVMQTYHWLQSAKDAPPIGSPLTLEGIPA